MSERDRTGDGPPRATRREVLGLVAALPFAGCAVESGSEVGEDPTPAGPPPLSDEPVEVGTLESISTGTLRVVDGQPLAIGRDDDGLWAVGTTCTHLGCNIANPSLGGNVDATGIRCGCHGSQYGPDGDVRVGPSVRNLPNYGVVVESDGRVLIDPLDIVPLGTRLTTA
jgi:Rieske Fe-S protein